jgi:hypothetical protein
LKYCVKVFDDSVDQPHPKTTTEKEKKQEGCCVYEPFNTQTGGEERNPYHDCLFFREAYGFPNVVVVVVGHSGPVSTGQLFGSIVPSLRRISVFFDNLATTTEKENGIKL